MNETSTPGPARPGAAHPGRRTALVALAALALGLAAGVRWHAAIAACFGAAPAASGPETQAPRQLWTCSMHPQVLLDHPGACPICRMTLVPVKNHGQQAAATTAGAAEAGAGERRVAYWWDPMMSPPYIAQAPGKSPMGMDLLPVYEDEVVSGQAVTIDPVVVQNMGVRVATVEVGPLRRAVRAVGYLREPEPRLHAVNLRVSGWIEHLDADTDGMDVTEGQPLFELYSPEITVAVEELIAARRARDEAGARPGGDPGPGARLYDAAVEKLRRWDLDEAQIRRLAALDRAPRTVTIASPISGHVLEKHVIEGAAVQSGQLAMTLSNRSTMWLDVAVFESDLPHVAVGLPARASLDAVPGREFEGQVTFIHPHVDERTRTALVRIELDNSDLSLRQGMYATALIESVEVPDAIQVPREAIIDTGERQLAFVSMGGGRFEPRRLELGAPGEGGMVQVLSGLAPGESVVTSGQFLLDSESRLREAIAKQLSDGLLVPPAAPPRPPER